MRISLDRSTSDGRPIYRRIAERIRGELAAERLAPGDRLPPIRELARTLGVNRDTVALAYEALAAAGVVESSVGRGTFIAGRPGRREELAPAVLPPLSPLALRLLDLERARPRFGSTEGAVPLHTLVPDPSLYPAEEFRRVLNRVLARGGPDLLLYGEPQGHPRMRAVLAERLRASGIAVGPDELVLCHGASQGIALALRLFAGPGDAVALEEPTYHNVLAAVAGLGLRAAPIPMRDGGLDLAAAERTLARPEVKVLYTIPSFHNPLGTTTSPGHRRAVVARHGRLGDRLRQHRRGLLLPGAARAQDLIAQHLAAFLAHRNPAPGAVGHRGPIRMPSAVGGHVVSLSPAPGGAECAGDTKCRPSIRPVVAVGTGKRAGWGPERPPFGPSESCYPASFSSSSRFTSFGSALPFVAAMTWPTRKPFTFCSPPWNFATAS